MDSLLFVHGLSIYLAQIRRPVLEARFVRRRVEIRARCRVLNGWQVVTLSASFMMACLTEMLGMRQARPSCGTQLAVTHHTHLLNELSCTCHGTERFTHLLTIGFVIRFRCKIIHILYLQLLSPFKFFHVPFVHGILLAMSSCQMVESSCSYIVSSSLPAVTILQRALSVCQSMVRSHIGWVRHLSMRNLSPCWMQVLGQIRLWVAMRLDLEVVLVQILCHLLKIRKLASLWRRT